MSRKLNIDDLELIVKDCVYIEKGVVCMSDTYYNDLIQTIENSQSKIDKVIELLKYFKNNSKDVGNEWAVEICELTIRKLKEDK